MRRSFWLLIMALGLSFMASPFIAPSVVTIILFIPGLPLFTTGLFLFMIKRGAHLAKWKFRDVYAMTINSVDHTWNAVRYDPNETAEIMVDEHVRPYMHDYRYIMSLKGWVPLTKYDGVSTRWKRAIKGLVKPRRVGLLLFCQDVVDDKGHMMPISHAHSYTGEYEAMSPEFLKKVCESRLAANFSRSLDGGKIKMNWILFAIVGIVILGLVLKLSGVL